MSYFIIIHCYTLAVIPTIADGSLFYNHIGDKASLWWKLDPIPVEEKSINTIHPSGTNLFIARGTVFQESETFRNRVDFTGNTTAGDMNFTLINVTENDAGVYTVNYDSADYMGTTLVIYVQPTMPTILAGTPVEGSDLDLVCSAESTSIPANNSLNMTYKWYINGTNLPDDTQYVQTENTLTIKNIQKSDNGTGITCTAEETVTLPSDMSLAYTIIPEYGPDILLIVPTTRRNYSMVNSLLGPITCSAECYPACNFLWRHDDVIFTTHKEIMIENIQKKHAGIYNCTASNKYGSMVSHDILVVVLVKPSTPVITSGVAVVGRNVKLKCSALSKSVPSSNLEMQYTWYSNGEILSNKIRYDQEGSILVIKNIQKSDKGLRITCQAGEVTSLPSDVSAAFTVNPQYPPSDVTFSPTITNYTLIVGSTLGPVTCNAVCYPKCNFSWIFDNTNISQTSLTIENIREEESGIYLCNASNIHGSQLSNDINVEVKPFPGNISVSPIGPVTVVEGGRLPVIKCTAVCFPECTYMWAHLDSKTTKGSVLNLGTATRNMSGIYICTASNQYSNIASGNLVINVLYGPGVSITFHPSIDHYEVTENTPFTAIHCSAACNPVCTFIWEKIEGARFSNPLNLGNVSRQKAGLYICRVSNVVDSFNKLLTISIMGKDDSTLQGTGDKIASDNGPNIASVILFVASSLIGVTCVVCGVYMRFRVLRPPKKTFGTRNVNSHASKISQHYMDIDKNQEVAMAQHGSQYGKLTNMDDTAIYESLQPVIDQALPVDTPIVFDSSADIVTPVGTNTTEDTVNDNTSKLPGTTTVAGNALHTADMLCMDKTQSNAVSQINEYKTLSDYLTPVTKKYIDSTQL